MDIWKRGIVYLLCDDSLDNTYKIGVTRGSLEKRIKKLQTGNAGEIFVFAKYETRYPFYLERVLHFKFGKQNIRNEWFELDLESALSFEKICKEEEDKIEILKENPFFLKNLK